MGDLKIESAQSHIIYHLKAEIYFHFRSDVELAGWAVTMKTASKHDHVKFSMFMKSEGIQCIPVVLF